MTPLISHTFISTSLGIFYQNKIQQNIYKKKLFNNDYGNRLSSNIISSLIISPIYNINKSNRKNRNDDSSSEY